jgi:hypothetical protein
MVHHFHDVSGIKNSSSSYRKRPKLSIRLQRLGGPLGPLDDPDRGLAVVPAFDDRGILLFRCRYQDTTDARKEKWRSG